MSTGDGGPAGGIPLPADALVVLVGASGSGKSTWAARHFRETEVVSSDRCRALVSDDEESQAVHREAFAVLYEIVRQRLSLRRLTVVDSTSLGEFSRRRLREIAERSGAPVHVVVFHAPEEALQRNNFSRDRRVPREAVAQHAARLEALLESGALESEGYAAVHHLPYPALDAPSPRIVEAARGPADAQPRPRGESTARPAVVATRVVRGTGALRTEDRPVHPEPPAEAGRRTVRGRPGHRARRAPHDESQRPG